MTSTLMVVCLYTHTPTEWKDSQLDSVDRGALEELITFSPPEIPKDAIWIMPTGGTPPTWDDLKGKVVVMQSWSNSDARSRQLVGAITKAIARTSNPEDVAILMVHTPKDIRSIEKYQTKHKIEVPTILDSSGEFCNKIGFYVDPTNIVIDRNGAVRHVGLGIRGLMKAVDSLLDESESADVEVQRFEPKQEEQELPVLFPTYSDNFGRAENRQGKQAPQFYVEEWLSEPVDTEDRVQMIEFWATWCVPCKRSIPHLNEYAEQYKDDLAVVGVSNESAQKVQGFMEKTKMHYGVAIDTKAKMKNSISCSAIPLTLIVSRDGVVRWQGNPLHLQEETLSQIIRADRGDTTFVKRGRWNVQEPPVEEK